MKEVLGFSVHLVGLYSSLPYLLMWAVSVGSGFLSDYLTARKYLSITQARKTFTALGMIPEENFHFRLKKYITKNLHLLSS